MPFDPPPPAAVPSTATEPLTAATMENLRSSYAAIDHHPSENHLVALEAVARTMEAMADGNCPPALYLAALDPGIGKTQTAKHFARALVASEAHRDVGMVICLGRLSQVETIAREIDLPRGSMAVLTSDPALNALSTAPVEDAQILLTTQQGIERRTDSGPFGAVEAFQFRGIPRAVRVWDEALEIAAPITIGWSAIAGLADIAMRRSSEFAEAVHTLAEQVRTCQTGDEVIIPDLQADHGICWREIEAALALGNGDQRQTALALRALNGTTARVYRDNHRGAVVVGFAQRIPEDIRPILVLDASVRVRQTYKDMEVHRGGVARLPVAVKDYGDLTIHLWETSGGKAAFATRGSEIVTALADTIVTKPDETWLVITHKPGPKVKNIEAAITAALPTKVRANVSFLTFGAHMATNDHADAANVILAGQLFAPTSHYVALTHAAQGRNVATGLVSMEEMEATRRGELADITLQGIARGRCRRSVGSKAAPMNAYVIAAPRSGIPGAIERIFPSCKIVPWTPLRKELKGNVRRAVEYVRAALDKDRTEVAYNEIREALGIDRGNFSKHVTTTEDWRDALAEMSCEIFQGPRRALLVRVAQDDPDLEEATECCTSTI